MIRGVDQYNCCSLSSISNHYRRVGFGWVNWAVYSSSLDGVFESKIVLNKRRETEEGVGYSKNLDICFKFYELSPKNSIRFVCSKYIETTTRCFTPAFLAETAVAEASSARFSTPGVTMNSESTPFGVVSSSAVPISACTILTPDSDLSASALSGLRTPVRISTRLD